MDDWLANDGFRKSPNIFGIDSEKVLTFLENAVFPFIFA